MVKLESRLKAFVKLGTFLREYVARKEENEPFNSSEESWMMSLDDAVLKAGQKNPWFTEEQVLFALKSWGNSLQEDQLNEWLTPYNLSENKSKNVALIMAGNIPLVGFHDFLAVLITGNRALIKLSSQDAVLLPKIAEYLISVEKDFASQIEFIEGTLKQFDAVIATGSNNTSRYFRHYFGKKPNIIRGNRNSVAVLTGEESDQELKVLGEDIFRYYGLGCRNVSKLYVPKNYSFDRFFSQIEHYNYLKNQHKYVNNYDYNKAVYLMSEFPFLDNGFVILKEDTGFASPISVVFYEFYEDFDSLKKNLKENNKQLQCVIGSNSLANSHSFGSAQHPGLADYADGVDTVEFLLKTS